MSMDGSENYKSFVNQQMYNASYQGMYKPSLTNMTNNPLLNPFAGRSLYRHGKRANLNNPIRIWINTRINNNIFFSPFR